MSSAEGDDDQLTYDYPDFVDSPNLADTKKELARRLGIAERYVHTVLAQGTTSLDLAKRIAEHWGGEPSKYLRRDRRRKAVDHVAWFMKVGAADFPFRDFIIEDADEHEGQERDTADWLIFNLSTLYEKAEEDQPPADFDSLESLLMFIRNLELDLESRDSIALVWKRFKLWRIGRVAALAAFDVEDENL